MKLKINFYVPFEDLAGNTSGHALLSQIIAATMVQMKSSSPLEAYDLARQLFNATIEEFTPSQIDLIESTYGHLHILHSGQIQELIVSAKQP